MIQCILGDDMTIGQRVKNARKAAGMTQADLAKKLNIPFQSISQWERDVRKPKFESLRKIAKEVNCPITDLLTEDDIPLVRLGYDVGRQVGSDEEIEYLTKALWYSFSDIEQEVVYLLAQLNEEVQQKAVERVEELTEIPKYQKETPQG